MKIFDFLLAALLVNFFHLNLFLCEGANVETETAEASTSQDGNKCPCRYSISKLIEITLKLKISGNQKEEKTILKKSKYPLGSGRYGKVYHAYWPDRKYCVAIKVVKRSKIFIREATKNEVEIHEYINENVTHRQRDYIIEMYGYRKHSNYFWKSIYMSIVMELGGKSLNNYFEQNNLLINNSVELRESNKREEVLTNIFICSAKALKQFHEFGVHNDIKADNFVIPHQSITDPLTTCKLIDLNLSKIRGQLNITGEYIQSNQKNDIRAFGVMMRTMTNTNTFPILNRVLKGCLLENPNHRPSMRAIVNFLEKICHRFSYELQNSVGNLCED